MNVELLRKVKKHILEEPKRLYMTSYMNFRKKDKIGRPFPKCGTTACIAGWACILTIDMEPALLYASTSIGFEAQRLLDLSSDEKYRLFEPLGWPEQFKQGASGDGKKKTAEIAAARIEHFIRTKGRE